MPNAQKIVKRFTNLKTLPHVAIKVAQLARDETSTMQEFEEIIKLDPVLVSRLLRLVNSPYFGLAQKVESISKAVVFTGMKQLRNLVTVESIRYLFDGGDEKFSPRNLWIHSATVAILSEMIAKRIFGKEGEDVFLAGIIHDIGLIVEDQVVGDDLRKACRNFYQGKGPLTECERDAIGTDHTQVGFLFAKEWNIPFEVHESIKSHHLSPKDNNISSIHGILQLAEYMAGKMNYWPIPGPVSPLPPALVQHIKERMTDYKIILRDLPVEMAKAKELYDNN